MSLQNSNLSTYRYLSTPGNFVRFNCQPSPVHDHMLLFKTVVYPEDIPILAKSTCTFKLESQESILIKLVK